MSRASLEAGNAKHHAEFTSQRVARRRGLPGRVASRPSAARACDRGAELGRKKQCQQSLVPGCSSQRSRRRASQHRRRSGCRGPGSLGHDPDGYRRRSRSLPNRPLPRFRPQQSPRAGRPFDGICESGDRRAEHCAVNRAEAEFDGPVGVACEARFAAPRRPRVGGGLAGRRSRSLRSDHPRSRVSTPRAATRSLKRLSTSRAND
jgi:hypothetical protein